MYVLFIRRPAWGQYLQQICSLVETQIFRDTKPSRPDIPKDYFYEGPLDFTLNVKDDCHDVARGYVSNYAKGWDYSTTRLCRYPGVMGPNPPRTQAGHAQPTYWTTDRTYQFLSKFLASHRMPGNLCQVEPPCKKPSNSITPDLVVLYENPRLPLPIPLITMEITGGKDVWGRQEAIYNGWVSALNTLAFLPTSFLFEIGDLHAEAFYFRRRPDKAKVDITSWRFEFAQLQHATHVQDILLQRELDDFTATIANSLFAQLANISYGLTAARKLGRRDKNYTPLPRNFQAQPICPTCYHFNNWRQLDRYAQNNDQFFQDPDSENDSSSSESSEEDDDDDQQDEDGGGDDGEKREKKKIYPRSVRREIKRRNRDRRRRRDGNGDGDGDNQPTIIYHCPPDSGGDPLREGVNESRDVGTPLDEIEGGRGIDSEGYGVQFGPRHVESVEKKELKASLLKELKEQDQDSPEFQRQALGFYAKDFVGEGEVEVALEGSPIGINVKTEAVAGVSGTQHTVRQQVAAVPSVASHDEPELKVEHETSTSDKTSQEIVEFRGFARQAHEPVIEENVVKPEDEVRGDYGDRDESLEYLDVEVSADEFGCVENVTDGPVEKVTDLKNYRGYDLSSFYQPIEVRNFTPLPEDVRKDLAKKREERNAERRKRRQDRMDYDNYVIKETEIRNEELERNLQVVREREERGEAKYVKVPPFRQGSMRRKINPTPAPVERMSRKRGRIMSFNEFVASREAAMEVDLLNVTPESRESSISPVLESSQVPTAESGSGVHQEPMDCSNQPDVRPGDVRPAVRNSRGRARPGNRTSPFK